jgi:hypothetical protein
VKIPDPLKKIPFFKEPVYTLKPSGYKKIVTTVKEVYGWVELPPLREGMIAFLKEAGYSFPEEEVKPGGILTTLDFAGDPEDPLLVEVNTNGGGYIPACYSHALAFGEDLLIEGKKRFLSMIQNELKEGKKVYLVDETPEEEFLYPEMVEMTSWIQEGGIPCGILPVKEIVSLFPALSFRDLKKKEGPPEILIYNRLTDFYLLNDSSRPLRSLWLGSYLRLSPSPIHYSTVGDKRIFSLLTERKIPAPIPETVPLARWMETYSPAERKEWVFKPATRFGGKGVYIGRKISQARLSSLPRDLYLAQRYISPIPLSHPRYGRIKGEIRVFTYKGEILLITLRGYKGQVMGFREEGEGFYPVAYPP